MPKEPKGEFRGLSRRARRLLRKDEGFEVDFKESWSSTKPEFFVAFANSPGGGTILYGVREIQDKRGRQRGQIVGCPITNEGKLSILDRAYNCIPSIDIDIFIENTGSTPFYRVEIPSGPAKPYCTRSSIYKIRKDARNKALEPTELLAMFLEMESGRFLQRFRSATESFETQFEQLNKNLFGGLIQTADTISTELNAHFGKMSRGVETMQNRLESALLNVEHTLGGIFGTAESAESLSGEAMSASEEAAAGIYEILGKISEIDEMRLGIEAIHSKLGIDPRIFQIRELVQLQAEVGIHRQMGKFDARAIYERLCERYPWVKGEIPLEQIEAWVEEAGSRKPRWPMIEPVNQSD